MTEAGFSDLKTPEDVENALNKKDGTTTLVVLNSVCGCAARTARPGALLALFNEVVPDSLVTLFAGMEKEAVNFYRKNYTPTVTPSSPNIALFKNGEFVKLLERHQIEGRSAGEIAGDLVEVFNTECTRKNDQESVDNLRSLFINRYQVDPMGA
ncbi:MAG: BrxA/BrxB family bacilliredoxin [Bacteroidota bacterium]|nr:BrxA/BrxB family bacilliredoxin [Bacteroidota bacterium]